MEIRIDFDIGLIGIGLRVLDAHNVIIRNLKIGKCQAPIDSIGVQGPTTKNVWIDHVDLYADQDHDKVWDCIVYIITWNHCW